MPRQRMYSENVGGNWGLPAGYMETLTAPGRSYAAAISSVGSSIAGAITKYQENKAEDAYVTERYEALAPHLEKFARGGNMEDKNSPESKTIAQAENFHSKSLAQKKAALHAAEFSLNRFDKDQEIQRQAQQQQFANSVAMQSQNMAGKYFNLAQLKQNYDFNLSQTNLNWMAADRAKILEEKEQTNAALREYSEMFRRNAGHPFVTPPLTQENLSAQLAKFKLHPDTLLKLSSLAPSQLDLDKFTVNKQNADTQSSYALRNQPRPEHGPISNKPEVVYDKLSDKYFVKNEKGGWEPLNPPKQDSFASFATLSIEKMNRTIDELEKMKLNGVKTARVDDNGVVHKSSWYRVDDDIDVLIQGFKQKMIEAGRLSGGNRGGTAGGADYTVDPNGKIVPIK